MKPAHERNQECLPPKKRDLPVNNASTIPNNNNSSSSSSSNPGGGAGGEGDEATTSQSSGASGETQGGSGGGEWIRTLPYGVEGPESMAPGLPVDQYGMLYKVAVPSGTYSPTSLHPVLGHISPAYTVPSPLLQHTGIPYPPLGYAPIPQFVSSPYATAVPYAVPPGFVPSPLISAQSHLVPYPSVIQEGVVSSPPQQPVPGHAYTKVAAAGGVPLVLASEHPSAASSCSSSQQQALGAVGMIPAAERVSVFYHPSPGDRITQLQSGSTEQGREVNGGDRENGRGDCLQDVVYVARNAAARVQQVELQDRKIGRQEGRASPGQRSTPDTDLEVSFFSSSFSFLSFLSFSFIYLFYFVLFNLFM